NHDLGDVAHQPGDLPPDCAGPGVVQNSGPVLLVAKEEGAAADQPGAGAAQPFGVVVVEAVVAAVVWVLVAEQGAEVAALALVAAVQRDHVADDDLAHRLTSQRMWIVAACADRRGRIHSICRTSPAAELSGSEHTGYRGDEGRAHRALGGKPYRPQTSRARRCSSPRKSGCATAISSRARSRMLLPQSRAAPYSVTTMSA